MAHRNKQGTRLTTRVSRAVKDGHVHSTSGSRSAVEALKKLSKQGEKKRSSYKKKKKKIK